MQDNVAMDNQAARALSALYECFQLLREPDGYSRHISEALATCTMGLEADFAFVATSPEMGRSYEVQAAYIRNEDKYSCKPGRIIDAKLLDPLVPCRSGAEGVPGQGLMTQGLVRAYGPSELTSMADARIESLIVARLEAEGHHMGVLVIGNPSCHEEFAIQTVVFLSCHISDAILRERQSMRLKSADRYRQECDFFEAAAGEGLVAKGHADLTANRMYSSIETSDVALHIDTSKSFDDAYAHYTDIVLPGEKRDRVAELFDRDWLLKEYRRGNDSFRVEFARNKLGSLTNWVRLEVRTYYVAATGHIEYFIYSYDVTEEHLVRLMLSRLSRFICDYLGVIDVPNETYLVYGLGESLEFDDDLVSRPYADRSRFPLFDEVLPDDRAGLVDNTEIPIISNALDANGSYSYFYSTIERGELRRKVMRYCYLFDESRVSILFVCIDVTQEYLNEKYQRERLRTAQREAQLDVLTGAQNRRGGVLALQEGFSLWQTSGVGTGILMFDIDDFKRFNDTYGHELGDEVLKVVSTAVTNCMRSDDVFIRWGGDEFIVMLRDFELDAAPAIEKKLLAAVKGACIKADGACVSVAISAGLTVFRQSDEGYEDAVNRADEALYEAKRSGKDRIVTAA